MLRICIIWIWRYGLAIAFFSLLIIATCTRSTVLVSDTQGAIAFYISPDHFNYLAWEAGAIRAKAIQTLFGLHAYVDEETRSQFVRDYMEDLAAAQQLASRIEEIYTDPTIREPETASSTLRIQKDELRKSLKERQSTAEAILEGQVAAILVEQGFGRMGQLFPPMAMRFTQVPNLLVISPRDQIRMESSFALDPLSTEERNQIENHLDESYEVSSLIIPLGGIALYPAMVIETASISFAVETFAHEWLHHYLFFYPLGISYFTGDALAGESRIINETTADLFGKEIARLVLQRYYPEQPLPTLPTIVQNQPSVTESPLSFDFSAEMHETRVRVDSLLASGDIQTAEAYMEERRIFFYEHGYRIRKLNQAFFAFYGGYQAGGGVSGAGGDDPIGPAIIQIRAKYIPIYEFIAAIRSVTDLDDLKQHTVP